MEFLTILKYFQIIVTLVLIVLVLTQSKGSNTFSAALGGSTHHTKRGPEKFLFIASAVFGTLFVLNSLLILALN